MAKKIPTDAEVQHRFAEFPYLAEDTDGTEYDDEVARFKKWLAEVSARAWQKGMDDLAHHLATRGSQDPKFPSNPYIEKA